MPKKIVNVYIEQGDHNYKMLFITLGYTVVSNFDAADLIVFTGGSDVSPHLYGDAAHRTTCNNTRWKLPPPPPHSAEKMPHGT